MSEGRQAATPGSFSRVAAAFVLALLVAVAVLLFGFGWDLKAVIGWRALVDYIDPGEAPERKDAVQVYAVIVAGVVAAVTAGVGLVNLHFTRKNLEQQRELETGRARGAALQAYYEQIGKLMTEKDLLHSQDTGVRALARGLTLAVMRNLDAPGKRSLMRFLQGAGLAEVHKKPRISLEDANLNGADLSTLLLKKVDLSKALLRDADLSGADLTKSSLKEADLRGAKLKEANLRGANLSGVIGKSNDDVVKETKKLDGATMPDGTPYR